MKARIEAGERDREKPDKDNAIPKAILPEDVAEGIFFLCSEAARAITGVTLPLITDGSSASLTRPTQDRKERVIQLCHAPLALEKEGGYGASTPSMAGHAVAAVHPLRPASRPPLGCAKGG